jgi:hypothetical protein
MVGTASTAGGLGFSSASSVSADTDSSPQLITKEFNATGQEAIKAIRSEPVQRIVSSIPLRNAEVKRKLGQAKKVVGSIDNSLSTPSYPRALIFSRIGSFLS